MARSDGEVECGKCLGCMSDPRVPPPLPRAPQPCTFPVQPAPAGHLSYQSWQRSSSCWTASGDMVQLKAVTRYICTVLQGSLASTVPRGHTLMWR